MNRKDSLNKGLNKELFDYYFSLFKFFGISFLAIITIAYFLSTQKFFKNIPPFLYLANNILNLSIIFSILILMTVKPRIWNLLFLPLSSMIEFLINKTLFYFFYPLVYFYFPFSQNYHEKIFFSIGLFIYLSYFIVNKKSPFLFIYFFLNVIIMTSYALLVYYFQSIKVLAAILSLLMILYLIIYPFLENFTYKYLNKLIKINKN